MPTDYRIEAIAMQYAKEWNETIDGVLGLRYDVFYKRSLLHKAITLKHPEFEGDRGEYEYEKEQHKKRLG